VSHHASSYESVKRCFCSTSSLGLLLAQIQFTISLPGGKKVCNLGPPFLCKLRRADTGTNWRGVAVTFKMFPAGVQLAQSCGRETTRRASSGCGFCPSICDFDAKLSALQTTVMREQRGQRERRVARTSRKTALVLMDRASPPGGYIVRTQRAKKRKSPASLPG